MFERFTERARQVPVYAQDEARAFRHDAIGTERLLLGLLREGDGLAARVLDSLGITIEEVRERLAAIVPPGEEETPGQIPFTPRAKRMLELSLREALSIGHNHIGTEHLLLGLTRDPEAVGSRILSDLGQEPEDVRSAVIGTISGPPGPGWTGYAPAPHRRRPRRRFRGLAIAREEALEEGNYDLARKLLELDIEDRRKRDEPKPDDV